MSKTNKKFLRGWAGWNSDVFLKISVSKNLTESKRLPIPSLCKSTKKAK